MSGAGDSGGNRLAPPTPAAGGSGNSGEAERESSAIQFHTAADGGDGGDAIIQPSGSPPEVSMSPAVMLSPDVSVELQPRPHLSVGATSGRMRSRSSSHTERPAGGAGAGGRRRSGSRTPLPHEGSHTLTIAPSDKSATSASRKQSRRERREAREARAKASLAPPMPAGVPNAGSGEIFHVLMYNSPKETLMAVTKSGMAKAMLPWFHLFFLAFNAGVMLSMSNLSGFVVGGGVSQAFAVSGSDGSGTVSESIAPQAIWAKFIHGAIFPVGLVLIVLAGSELVTGNVMYLSAAVLAGKAPKWPALGRLGMAWLGNFVGSVVCAFLLAYLPKIMHSGPQYTYLASVAHKKLAREWGATLLKGVGCNWLVCMALWCNLTAQDIISKIVAIWMPIAVFFWIGWEHVVANFFTLPLALMEDATGTDGFGEILAWNIIPVSLGNLIGGAAFAFAQWFIYGEHSVVAPVKVGQSQQLKLLEHLKPQGGSRMRRAARHTKELRIELHPSDIADSANPHRATGRGLLPIERRTVATVQEQFQSGDTSASESDHSPMPSPMASPVLHTRQTTG